MEYGKTAVTANILEKKLNVVLDFVTGGTDSKLSEDIFRSAAEWLLKLKNERVWFRTQLRFGKFLIDKGEFDKLSGVLKELYKPCLDDKGHDDQKNKGSQLIDIYALEIQMYTANKNSKKQKELYQKAKGVLEHTIPHPKIIGIIKECGGKMHMREKQWTLAQTDFFEAFTNYAEAGAPQRIPCLKYYVLANMLSLSKINPFDSPETKPYKDEPEIVAMTNLVAAYENNEIKSFEDILKKNSKALLEDEFIRDYIKDLLKNIRTQVLLRLLTPYRTIRLQYIASELNISTNDVLELIVELILDSKILGKVDQINLILRLEGSKTKGIDKFAAKDKG